MTQFTNTQATQTNYKTRRQRDEQDEKIVGQFLDTYFYPTWCSAIARNTDRLTQIQGLDVTTLDGANAVYKIDEKAATRWAGRRLNTFAFEISAVNIFGEVYKGWLLDDKSISDYLVIVWIDEINSETLQGAANITDATVALIRKSDLWNFLNYKGLTKEYLFSMGDYLRQMGMNSHKVNGFKITCQQPPIQERAANILIHRDTIINNISCYAMQIKNGQQIRLR